MALSTTYVSRDPVARTTLVRDLLAPEYRIDCKWCGRPGAKFVYTTEHDGGHEARHPGVFCSAPCFRSYHGT